MFFSRQMKHPTFLRLVNRLSPAEGPYVSSPAEVSCSPLLRLVHRLRLPPAEALYVFAIRLWTIASWSMLFLSDAYSNTAGLVGTARRKGLRFPTVETNTNRRRNICTMIGP